MKNKEGSFRVIIIVMFLTMIIAFNWENWSWLSGSIHAILDPTAGALLNWEMTVGMLIIVMVITVITTLVQKYATDQDKLRELKKDQKKLQEEMKKHRSEPQKMKALQKKQMEMMPQTMKLSMRSIIDTGIPFVLFFRWFDDFFRVVEESTGAPVRFLGIFSWFWFYLIFTMVFSTILRKKMNVV
jgi:uncharacterized membrane protein (DUF106 family)